MNVRKPVDYSTMFSALDELMAAALPQMELYHGIGQLISSRPEKGAAVAAAEYLSSTQADASGFSPRNLRRMREFSVPSILFQLCGPDEICYYAINFKCGYPNINMKRHSTFRPIVIL